MADEAHEDARPWFLAICLDCEPVLSQPFSDPGERDAWAIAHRVGTGHTVARPVMPPASPDRESIIPAEPPAIVFEVPTVRWPTEGTLTLVRDVGLREGQALTMTDRDGKATVFRVTKVVTPDDDDPDPRWTVSVVEWEKGPTSR